MECMWVSTEILALFGELWSCINCSTQQPLGALCVFFPFTNQTHMCTLRWDKSTECGPSDISTSDMARYGLCNVVASCSCHHLHGGSRSLESCPLSGSLRQTKACFCLTKYLASIFTALWSNKVPFNSLIHGYAYPHRSLLSTMSVCTGIEYINLHIWIHVHIRRNNCSFSWFQLPVRWSVVSRQ